MTDMTPAPISVERLRELQREMETSCTWEAERDFQAAALEALPALLQQLAEREAEVERLRDVITFANSGVADAMTEAEARIEAAERAREEACGLLRESIGEIRDAATDARVANLPNRGAHLDKLAVRVAAFLAASGGA